MENRIDKAIEYFDKGFNCSQSVFTSYASLFGIDNRTALKLSCGFGSGMGTLQKTCGAVTGAFMIIGLNFGKWQAGDDLSKQKTYAMIKNFASEFISLHHSIDCLELLGCDISTPQGLKRAREKGIFKSKCKKYVEDAAMLIEKIVFNP